MLTDKEWHDRYYVLQKEPAKVDPELAFLKWNTGEDNDVPMTAKKFMVFVKLFCIDAHSGSNTPNMFPVDGAPSPYHQKYCWGIERNGQVWGLNHLKLSSTWCQDPPRYGDCVLIETPVDNMRVGERILDHVYSSEGVIIANYGRPIK